PAAPPAGAAGIRPRRRTMTDPSTTGPIEKLPVGIPGFDLIALGGLPQGRTTLVVGSAGSAKTVFASQFLAEGVARGEHGVFVTFEEPPRDVRRNLLGFGWDVARWEAEGAWTFVDASPHPEEEAVVTGEYDMGGLLARMEHAVRAVGADRVAMDSLGAVFARFAETSTVRRELFRIVSTL